MLLVFIMKLIKKIICLERLSILLYFLEKNKVKENEKFIFVLIIDLKIYD